jgi:Leucine-rich repeat (LRR) protein
LTISLKGERDIINQDSDFPLEIGDLTELVRLEIKSKNGEFGLGGELPSSISKLKKLVNLIILDSDVDGTLPIDIGEMTSLEYLKISNTFLEGEIPKSICLLSNLKELSLRWNKVTGNDPF